MTIPGDEIRTEEFGLKPEQRFTTWAKAKSHGEGYQGLSLGKYLRSMIAGPKTDVERRALSEGTDSAGGYTVPTVLSAEMIDLARANSVVMQAGARTMPLSTKTNTFAKLLTDPVPAWRLEAGAVAESDPTFGLVTLTPQSLAVQMHISKELASDSINLAVELPRIVAAAMAKELDRVALLGTGTAPEPEGILNMTGIGTTAHAAAWTSPAPLSVARTSILTANAGPVSAIVMHPRDEGTQDGFQAGDGQPILLSKGLRDIQILTSTAIPINGGAGTNESTIFVGNFQHLWVGIRQDIEVEILKSAKYTSNLQFTLVAHMRADVVASQVGAFHTITAVTG